VLFTLLGPFTFDTSIVPLLVRLIDSIVPLLNRPDTDEVIVLLRERVGGGGGGGGATDAIEIEDDDDDASAVLLLRDFRFGTSSSMKKQFVNTPLLVKKPCQDKKNATREYCYELFIIILSIHLFILDNNNSSFAPEKSVRQ